MRIGKLDRRITIQDHVDTVDGFGQPVVSEWSTFANVWAQVMPLKGREYVEANIVTAESTVRFMIRYRDGVTRDMRILYDAEIYGIEHIAEVGRRKGLEIVARVIRDEG